MKPDVVASTMELLAVALLALGAALAVSSAIGGLLGVGCGFVAAALIVGAASAAIKIIQGGRR